MDADIKEQFDTLNARFDSMQFFMMEHVVTKQELEDRLSDLPTKQDFQTLVSAVDGYAKQVNDANQEILILGEKANRIGLSLGSNTRPAKSALNTAPSKKARIEKKQKNIPIRDFLNCFDYLEDFPRSQSLQKRARRHRKHASFSMFTQPIKLNIDVTPVWEL